VSEGNFLGKKRKNFFLSKDCCRYIVELCYRLGLSEGGVIELAIREKYDRTFEKRESMRDPNPRSQT
jgi:hypothetical protein